MKLLAHLAAAAFAGGSLLLAAACQASAPLWTASGRPEMEIRTAARAEVLQCLVETLGLHGFELLAARECTAIFSKPAEDTETRLLMGARKGQACAFRVTCELGESEGGVTIVGDIQLVSNPGTEHQRVKDYSRESEIAHEVQGALEELVATLALARHRELIRELEADETADPEAPLVWTGGK